jgi:Tol biopolymer transport system component
MGFHERAELPAWPTGNMNMVNMIRNVFRLTAIMWLFVGLSASETPAEPVALTSGPGNDTEAVWSPDGKQIAFQSDRGGNLGLYVSAVASGRVRTLVAGPGHAATPAWSPDGKWIAYTYAHFTKTALEGLENGYNVFLVPAVGGTARRLTRGPYHDACPQFSRDGREVWFSSDRDAAKGENVASLFRVAIAGGEPTLVRRQAGHDRAIIQPTFSSDGGWIAFGRLNGFRDNWHLNLARADRLDDGFSLTDARGSFYAPRFSPTGSLLACTGFQVGDPGWGVYLVDARSRHRLRVDCGPGNSRSPAWSPDGRQLVLENNRSGQYKLYRVDVPAFPLVIENATKSGVVEGAVLQFSFRERPGTTVADHSRAGNAGQVRGHAEWNSGAVRLDTPGTSIAVPAARGFDFGTGPFAVRATVKLPAECRLAMIATGEYPGNALGWQLYVGDDHRVYFNSRDVKLVYRGARSDEPLALGRPVTLVGVREADGAVRLYVDGVLQRSSAPGADYAYGQPKQVRIGTARDGGAAFPGWIYEVLVLRRTPTEEEQRGDSLARFWDESQPR